MAATDSPSSIKTQDVPTTQANPTSPVDVTYSFVWSELSAEKPRRHERDPDAWIRIRSARLPPNNDGSLRCTAAFFWGTFLASFDCLYHPSTGRFSCFKVREETMKGGMEDIDGAEVYFVGEQRVGKEEDGRGEVRDDDGNLFLVVELDFGYSGCVEAWAHVYGKKTVTEEERREGVRLSSEERVRLGISEERWEAAMDVRDGEDEDE